VTAGISGGFGFGVMVVLSCGRPRKLSSLIEFFDRHFVIGKGISLTGKRLDRCRTARLVLCLIKA